MTVATLACKCLSVQCHCDANLTSEKWKYTIQKSRHRMRAGNGRGSGWIMEVNGTMFSPDVDLIGRSVHNVLANDTGEASVMLVGCSIIVMYPAAGLSSLVPDARRTRVRQNTDHRKPFSRLWLSCLVVSTPIHRVRLSHVCLHDHRVSRGTILNTSDKKLQHQSARMWVQGFTGTWRNTTATDMENLDNFISLFSDGNSNGLSRSAESGS